MSPACGLKTHQWTVLQACMVDLARWLKLNELTSYIKSKDIFFETVALDTRNDTDIGRHTNMVGASD